MAAGVALLMVVGGAAAWLAHQPAAAERNPDPLSVPTTIPDTPPPPGLPTPKTIPSPELAAPPRPQAYIHRVPRPDGSLEYRGEVYPATPGLALTWDVVDAAGRSVAEADGAGVHVPPQPSVAPVFVRLRAIDAAGATVTTDVMRGVSPAANASLEPTNCTATPASATCPGIAIQVMPGATSLDVRANPAWSPDGSQDLPIKPDGTLRLFDPTGAERDADAEGRFTPYFDLYVYSVSAADLRGLPAGNWTATWLPKMAFHGDIYWDTQVQSNPVDIAWPAFPDGWRFERQAFARPVEGTFATYVRTDVHDQLTAPARIDLALGIAYRDDEDALQYKSYARVPAGFTVAWQVFDENATEVERLDGPVATVAVAKPGAYTARALVWNGARLATWSQTTFSVSGMWMAALSCQPAHVSAVPTGACNSLQAWMPRGATIVDAIVTPRAAYDPYLTDDPADGPIVLRDGKGQVVAQAGPTSSAYGRIWQIRDTPLHCLPDSGVWTLTWEAGTEAAKGDTAYELDAVFCGSAAKPPPPP